MLREGAFKVKGNQGKGCMGPGHVDERNYNSIRILNGFNFQFVLSIFYLLESLFLKSNVIIYSHLKGFGLCFRTLSRSSHGVTVCVAFYSIPILSLPGSSLVEAGKVAFIEE